MTEPGRAALDVILPVHNGRAALTVCLRHLARTLDAATQIEIIDDASTDPLIWPLLEAFQSAHPERVRLQSQAQNLGFVATVEAAIRRSRHDVVLLNSDTVPTRGWLERLRVCLASDPRIATATPFSNNAEICSFPELCRAAPVPDDPDRMAAACRAAGPPSYPELPTGVGFCLAVSRRALEQLGGFDVATFGLGYGEENDFCRRAAGHGWRNVLCDDAFVGHVGNVSFGERALSPGGVNAERLSARYPDYNRLVAEFIANDPLAARRTAIQAALEAGMQASP